MVECAGILGLWMSMTAVVDSVLMSRWLRMLWVSLENIGSWCSNYSIVL